MIMASSAFAILAAAFVMPLRTPAPSMGRAAAAVMQEPGSKVDMEAIGWEERTWKKRNPDAEVTTDGACFIVADEEAPDPSKQWFFCSDPSDDEGMVCELVPEWMGSSPDGGHAVWMCSMDKPE